MQFHKELGFLLGAIATAMILVLVRFDESKVGLRRLENALQREVGLKEAIARRCGKLLPRRGTSDEKFFVDRFAPPRRDIISTDGGTGGVDETECHVTLQGAHAERFALRTFQNYLLRVETETAGVFYERNYRLQYPRPLVFLPIALFLLALIFEFRGWGMLITFSSYVFLLAGGSLIRTVELAAASALLTVWTDSTFVGLAMMLLWLASFLARQEIPSVTRDTLSTMERRSSRAATFLLGLWNPIAYTALGPLLHPLRGTVTRLSSFLDGQFLVACVSLYLLAPGMRTIAEVAERSLLLPRYFSFAAILFLVLGHWLGGQPRIRPAWRVSRFWLAPLTVLLVEALALKLEWLGELPTLVRVGGSLLVSEMAQWKHVVPKKAARTWLPWASMLFVGSFLAMATQRAGVIDLAIVLADVRIHPTTFVFFTFIAGWLLGFLTGNFAVSFFPLLLMLKGHDQPQARAALVDGILAGMLLSPFSLFNLLAASQFGITLPRLVAYRWRQLAYPLLIGGLIYFIAAIRSVGILQPVTFVFLCLVAVTFHLRKRTWNVSSGLPTPPAAMPTPEPA